MDFGGRIGALGLQWAAGSTVPPGIVARLAGLLLSGYNEAPSTHSESASIEQRNMMWICFYHEEWR
ncbi:hypothetical protein AFCA_010034 [Aspergillus flavus]|nr:hypothetical protein AFCA_010034 [Aspergillus flavus]